MLGSVEEATKVVQVLLAGDQQAKVVHSDLYVGVAVRKGDVHIIWAPGEDVWVASLISPEGLALALISALPTTASPEKVATMIVTYDYDQA